MDGLIIKPEWLAQIYEPVRPFSEPKTLEIRGSATKKRGRIYLLESGSGLVTGETTIVDCVQIKDKSDWDAKREKHQVLDIEYQGRTIEGYLYARTRYNGQIYGWVLKNTVKYETPIRYDKPKGAIIWVKDVEKLITWRKAEFFDHFVAKCDYFNGETDANNGYGCNHPEQEEQCDGQGCCYCFSCPLGYPADEESLLERDIVWTDGRPEADGMEEDSYIIVESRGDCHEETKQ